LGGIEMGFESMKKYPQNKKLQEYIIGKQILFFILCFVLFKQ